VKGERVAATVGFLILGPVTIQTEAQPVALEGGRHARAVLLDLLLDVGRAVPVDRIVWDVWGDSPPPSVERIVRSNVSRIRHVVGPSRLRSIDHSYVLDVDPRSIDAVRFEQSVIDAAHLQAVGRAADAAESCRDALRLWRGPVFGDLGDEEFTRLEALRLTELRARAVELHFESELALGETGQIIGRLRAEAESFRYRERLWALLITALSREGRRAEALRAYDEARALLGAIGLEPCTELRSLVEQVVREEPTVAAHLME